MGHEYSFGKALQAARARAGWTQREAAERIGVSANTLSRWELDQVSPTGALRARALELYGLVDAPVTREALRGFEERLEAVERHVAELDARLRSGRS
jgi:transcriptional regulator with XRE-family HTH domain